MIEMEAAAIMELNAPRALAAHSLAMACAGYGWTDQRAQVARYLSDTSSHDEAGLS